MSIRYIFNTSGEYVAFVSNNNVFTPMSEWIGFLPEANIVYNLDGTYMGEISVDDRIIKRKHAIGYRKLNRPLRQPLRPLRPLRPLKRLRLPKLPYPYKDVFEKSSNLKPSALIKDFSYLIESNIFAFDKKNTFLGSISNNRFNRNSILNPYGPYGNKYSNTSIFNQYCLFSGKYGRFSPFNKYSRTPPRIVQNDQFIAWLTVNKYLNRNIVDTNDFLDWLSTLN